jgi:oxalate decarboxylase/phosphoglucose isomerase-like protein (cupin superfamily)
MYGMEGITGQYFARRPVGGSTKRERHLYEKLIYIIRGTGATVVEDGRGREHTFEWHEGSFFAVPLNCYHRLYAHGEPVLYTAFTTAPMVFDLFYNDQFVYETPFVFKERFDGQPEFFSRESREGRSWVTNFIPDVRKARIDPSESRGPGTLLSQFEIADNSLIGHLAHWPNGRYMLAHYHGGGAILLIIQGEGFSLMWSNAYGERPFENGYGDKVVRIDWKPGSAFSPPTDWYHQHFNTGPEWGLQLALRNGSSRHPLGIRASHGTAFTSTIPLDREDPAIREMYLESLRSKGLPADMPIVVGASD